MSTSDNPTPLAISRGELLGLTFGIWLGGIGILTVLPILIMPLLGPAVGIAVSYVVFFIAWQPVNMITQRTIGMGPAIVRQLVLVASGAVIAYYLREMLFGMARS
jgi:hypothetical protein